MGFRSSAGTSNGHMAGKAPNIGFHGSCWQPDSLMESWGLSVLFTLQDHFCVTNLRSFLCFPPWSVTVGGGMQQAADTPILIVFSWQPQRSFWLCALQCSWYKSCSVLWHSHLLCLIETCVGDYDAAYVRATWNHEYRVSTQIWQNKSFGRLLTSFIQFWLPSGKGVKLLLDSS